MTYKILSTRQVDVTLFTTVEYNFDSTILTIEVDHFMPKTQADIDQKIISRAETEMFRMQESISIAALAESIVIGEEKSI
jgi:hypothetical protein